MNKDGLLIIVFIKIVLWINMCKYIVIYLNIRIMFLYLKYNNFKKRVVYKKNNI